MYNDGWTNLEWAEEDEKSQKLMLPNYSKAQ